MESYSSVMTTTMSSAVSSSGRASPLIEARKSVIDAVSQAQPRRMSGLFGKRASFDPRNL